MRTRTRTVQLAQYLGESQLCLSCLEAVTHRGANSALRLRLAYFFAKGIGIAAKLLGRCERDGIDPDLSCSVTRGRKAGNPLSQLSDEIPEGGPGQRSIAPAVPFSQLGVVILGAQHDLERPPSPHEPGEVLTGTAAREQAEG